MGCVQDVKNLDILCAEKGRNLAQIDKMEERIVNATLAVLEEQGPYAAFLYLKARHGEIFKKAEKVFEELLLCVFKKGGKDELDNQEGGILSMISTLAEDLDSLLFARDLLRNTLSYARYHLKAEESGEKTS